MDLLHDLARARFPFQPPKPEAQNRQPTGHPTCELMHAVFGDPPSGSSRTRSAATGRAPRPRARAAPVAPPPPASPARSGAGAGESHCTSSFCVPSLAIWCETVSPERNAISPASVSRSPWREVGHLRRIDHALDVDPLEDLLGAERLPPAVGAPRGERSGRVLEDVVGGWRHARAGRGQPVAPGDRQRHRPVEVLGDLEAR
jgi:hypothetical protein